MSGKHNILFWLTRHFKFLLFTDHAESRVAQEYKNVTSQLRKLLQLWGYFACTVYQLRQLLQLLDYCVCAVYQLRGLLELGDYCVCAVSQSHSCANFFNLEVIVYCACAVTKAVQAVKAVKIATQYAIHSTWRCKSSFYKRGTFVLSVIHACYFRCGNTYVLKM